MHPTQCWDDTWTQGAHSWCRPLYPLAHVFDYPSAHSQVLFASTWRDGVRSDRRTEAHSQPHNGIMDHNTYSPSPTQPPPSVGCTRPLASVRVCVCVCAGLLFPIVWTALRSSDWWSVRSPRPPNHPKILHVKNYRFFYMNRGWASSV